MTDLQKEFKKYAREEFDCDVVEVPRDKADTFENLFGADFMQLHKQGESKVLKIKAERIKDLGKFGFAYKGLKPYDYYEFCTKEHLIEIEAATRKIIVTNRHPYRHLWGITSDLILVFYNLIKCGMVEEEE